MSWRIRINSILSFYGQPEELIIQRHCPTGQESFANEQRKLKDRSRWGAKMFSLSLFMAKTSERCWGHCEVKLRTFHHNSPPEKCSDSSRSRPRRFSPDSPRFDPRWSDRRNAILYSASLLSLSYHQAACPSRRNRLGTPTNVRPKRNLNFNIFKMIFEV